MEEKNELSVFELVKIIEKCIVDGIIDARINRYCQELFKHVPNFKHCNIFSESVEENHEKMGSIEKNIQSNDENDINYQHQKLLLESWKEMISSISENCKCESKKNNEQTFQEAAEPLMKYLAENHHMGCTAIVSSAYADLAEIFEEHATDKFVNK